MGHSLTLGFPREGRAFLISVLPHTLSFSPLCFFFFFHLGLELYKDPYGMHVRALLLPIIFQALLLVRGACCMLFVGSKAVDGTPTR